MPNINVTIEGDQINNSNSNVAEGGSSSSTGGNSSATGGSNNNNISSGNSSATGTGGAGGAGGSASAGNSSSTSNANNSGSSNNTNTSTNSGSASNNANNSTNNSSNTSSGVYDSGNSSNTNNNSSTNNSSNSNSNDNTSNAEVDLEQDFDFNIELEGDEDYFQHAQNHGNSHGNGHGHGHGHHHQCVDPHQGKNFICHVYDFTGRSSLATQLAGAPHIGSFYMDRFDVTPRSWTLGFPKFPPSLSHLLENYAIRCFAKLRVTQTGTHTFSIVSDDGMRVLLNGTPVVEDDGLHAPRSASATTNLTRGLYNLEVQYFQGPRTQIAAELKWSTPHNPTSRYIDTPDLQKVVRSCH
jgi:hypothetical protein